MSLPETDGNETSLRARFRPIRTRSKLAAAGLASDAFLSVVVILGCVLRIVLLRSVQAPTQVSQPTLRVASSLFIVSGVGLQFLVVIFTAITFLFWIYRAHQNLLAFRPEPLENAPADGVWSFFVPIINLFKPYFVMREIWVESDPALPPFGVPTYTSEPSSPLVAIWWVLFLARGVLGSIALIPRRGGQTTAAAITMTEIHIVSYAVSALAAVVACLLVLRILRRQENLAEQLTVLDRVGVF